ncbi:MULTISPECIES: hypothetical protein [Niastella]|uniref:DUF4738 domain-containing protein n=1 Tax=Niastella soli TaxID=2821487 RepID=A0ABS3Z1F2_9BACT|nr:hypothetical protein [Niastella soli]MBO9203992.1 hypothetical protein [Niastella soli]
MLKLFQLKTIPYLLFISLVFAGCSDVATTEKSKGADSTKRVGSSTVKAVEEKGEYNEEGYNEEEEIKNFIRQMSQLCENPVIKDTVFIMGKDSVSLAFNHNCTGDSFPLPAKYLETYKLDRFTGHSLKSDIAVKKNGVNVLNKRIEKGDFESLIDGNLKEYGVLLYPHIGAVGDTIYIDYSISIPLTDIGIGVRASILKDGSVQYTRN